MSLFNNVGNISKVNTDFTTGKINKAIETKIGIISFQFGTVPQVKAALDLFGEDDARLALDFADVTSKIDPDANSL